MNTALMVNWGGGGDFAKHVNTEKDKQGYFKKPFHNLQIIYLKI